MIQPRDRRRMWYVFALTVIMAIVEALGVASIMPFIAVASNPQIIDSNLQLRYLYRLGEFDSQRSFLIALGMLTFLVLTGSIAMRALNLWAITKFSADQIKFISCRLVESYLRQPYVWFLNRHSADFGTNVLNEVASAIHGALNPAMTGVAHLLVATALVSLLVAVDPMLSIAAMVLVGGTYSAVYMLVKRRLARIGELRRVANMSRNRVLHEAFGGIKDVKIGGLEARFLSLFEQPSQVFAKHAVTAGVLTEMPSLGIQAFVFGGMVLTVLYLIAGAGGIQTALPVIALYGLAAARLLPSLQGVYKSLGTIRFHAAVVHTLAAELRDLSTSALSLADPHAGRLSPRSTIELRNVCFQYPSADRPALRDLSLIIPVRTSVGIVGSTGSGKTTLVDVILGLLSPQSGQIVVDGAALGPEQIRGWQRAVGYVPQAIFLTDASVAENIAFGLPKDQIDMVRVETAARAANLHGFVCSDLPLGYDTVVGEKGVRLSGGQRQRIGIARSLYWDPDVLIFDEATSALDTLTEVAVMEAIQKLGGRKTIILIAHRLTTIRSCDLVVLMDRGEVAATGSFDELLQRSPEFQAMARHVA